MAIWNLSGLTSPSKLQSLFSVFHSHLPSTTLALSTSLVLFISFTASKAETRTQRRRIALTRHWRKDKRGKMEQWDKTRNGARPIIVHSFMVGRIRLIDPSEFRAPHTENNIYLNKLNFDVQMTIIKIKDLPQLNIYSSVYFASSADSSSRNAQFSAESRTGCELSVYSI